VSRAMLAGARADGDGNWQWWHRERRRGARWPNVKRQRCSRGQSAVGANRPGHCRYVAESRGGVRNTSDCLAAGRSSRRAPRGARRRGARPSRPRTAPRGDRSRRGPNPKAATLLRSARVRSSRQAVCRPFERRLVALSALGVAGKRGTTNRRREPRAAPRRDPGHGTGCLPPACRRPFVASSSTTQRGRRGRGGGAKHGRGRAPDEPQPGLGRARDAPPFPSSASPPGRGHCGAPRRPVAETGRGPAPRPGG